jgi:hypothetical protein
MYQPIGRNLLPKRLAESCNPGRQPRMGGGRETYFDWDQLPAAIYHQISLPPAAGAPEIQLRILAAMKQGLDYFHCSTTVIHAKLHSKCNFA